LRDVHFLDLLPPLKNDLQDDVLEADPPLHHLVELHVGNLARYPLRRHHLLDIDGASLIYEVVLRHLHLLLESLVDRKEVVEVVAIQLEELARLFTADVELNLVGQEKRVDIEG